MCLPPNWYSKRSEKHLPYRRKHYANKAIESRSNTIYKISKIIYTLRGERHFSADAAVQSSQ